LISPLAGKLAPLPLPLDVPTRLAAYIALHPDTKMPAQRVAFGTCGHRGSAFACSFNAWHPQAISQLIFDYRKSNRIGGPLYIGSDTHALAPPTFESALEMLAANEPGRESGEPVADHTEGPASAAQKRKLAKLSPQETRMAQLAGKRSKAASTVHRATTRRSAASKGHRPAAGSLHALRAPKRSTRSTRSVFRSDEHLSNILRRAPGIVDAALTGC